MGTFYPSPLNHSFLVLPYLGICGGAKEVHLDLSVVLNKHMVVRRLHRRRTSGGDEAVLPPIYLKDPGIPGTLEVGYLGPLWENSQYTTTVPAGGTGLRGVRLAISEVTFCPDEKNARRSLAPMQGEGIIYSPKWYDKSGKPLENSNAVQPNNLSKVPLDHDSELGGDEPDNEVTSAPPVPNDMVGDGSDKDDAKSREASGAGSDSGSGSSGSGSSSGSEDSSQDSASSRSGSGEGDTNSDAQGNAPRRKVRQKKKPHQSFNAESDEESAPKVTTDKTGGNADGEAKRTSQDSGLGDGATAHPVTGSSGAGMAALLGVRHAADAGGIGPLPLPTTLPSMATLEALTGDLEKLGGKLFRGLEETNLAVYDKVLQGFKDTSGKCKNFIHEMGSLVVTFFAQAEEMEKGLAECDAMAFREAMSASKGHVCGLIEQVAEAEGIFDAGEVNFDSVLASVAKEVKAYV